MPKNNLLFIITDQQRHDAVGYKNSIVITPNIDKLSSESIVCDQAIVQSPQCQPSRASILTGLYPDNIQMWWNETRLDLKYRTIGNILQDQGYDTAYFGKLHVDSQLNFKQTAQYFGFEHQFLTEDWISLLSSHKDVYPHAVKQVKREFYAPMHPNHTSMSSEYLAPWTGKLSSKTLHHEDVITDKAINYLEQSKEPFACFVSFHGPHPPYVSPAPYNQLYEYGDIPLPDKLLPTWFGHQLTSTDWHHIKSQYYGAISWIDSYIGNIISHIDMNNTVVVFTSDHGDILGDHGLFSKGIFTYEGNIRVPLIIKAPNVGYTKYDHIVQLTDLLPTVLALMGVETQLHVDGTDLSRAFKDNTPINKYAYSSIGIDPRMYMIRSDRYKYSVNGSESSFFDLHNDPSESHDLIYDHSYSRDIAELRSDMVRCLCNLNNSFASKAVKSTLGL